MEKKATLVGSRRDGSIAWISSKKKIEREKTLDGRRVPFSATPMVGVSRQTGCRGSRSFFIRSLSRLFFFFSPVFLSFRARPSRKRKRMRGVEKVGPGFGPGHRFLAIGTSEGKIERTRSGIYEKRRNGSLRAYGIGDAGHGRRV